MKDDGFFTMICILTQKQNLARQRNRKNEVEDSERQKANAENTLFDICSPIGIILIWSKGHA